MVTIRGVSADHYFTADPTAKADRRHVGFSLFEREYRLVASGGVFSSSRLDPGTSVLLHKAPLPAPDSPGPLLDLGCGYGPIAVVLATAAPETPVYAVDVNRRALDLVRENATSVDAAERIVAATPDEVPDDVRFREIWSNPPIRIGKAELHALLLRWLPRLAPDGVAWLVVARNLGADSLQVWLIERGWSVERHASQKGYRVFRVERRGNAGDETADVAQNG
jgi:16S rRNA (guanine1207-N2)-methyltransferase